jgi:hypothetical protein
VRSGRCGFDLFGAQPRTFLAAWAGAGARTSSNAEDAGTRRVVVVLLLVHDDRPFIKREVIVRKQKSPLGRFISLVAGAREPEIRLEGVCHICRAKKWLGIQYTSTDDILL